MSFLVNIVLALSRLTSSQHPLDNPDIEGPAVSDNDGPPVERGREHTPIGDSSLAEASLAESKPPDPADEPSISRRWTFRCRPAYPDSNVVSYRRAPILAGLAVPIAILLQIPGLVSHWYIRTDANQIVQTQPNPAILDVGLALSMCSGVIAIIALIVRFLEIRVKLTTIVCVAFLSLHDIVNIIAVSSFGVVHRFSDGFTYGQAFWLTLCSTAASLFTNMTLQWDLYRTPNFSESGSGLTRKQRSLIIIVIVQLCYIAFGALINTFLSRLSFIDALYFTVVSIETIGFGDISPPTQGARAFNCIFVFVGVVNLALAVSLAREAVLESMEAGSQWRLSILQDRIMKAKKSRKHCERWRQAIEWRLREKGLEVWVVDDDHSQNRSHRWALISSFFRPFASRLRFQDFFPGPSRSASAAILGNQCPKGMRLNLESLTRTQLGAAAMEAGILLDTMLPPDFKAKGEIDCIDTSPTRWLWLALAARSQSSSDDVESGDRGFHVSMVRNKHTRTQMQLGSMISMLGTFALAMNANPSELSRPTLGRRKKSMVDLLYEGEDNDRDILMKEEAHTFYIRMFLCWTFFLTFWMTGAAVFSSAEHWTFGNATYFCFVAFATIGYGDMSPKTPAGRSLFVVWALMGVAAMTVLFSVMSEAYNLRYKTAMDTFVFPKAVKLYRQRRSLSRTIASATNITHLACSGNTPRDVGVGSDADNDIPASQRRLTEKLSVLPHQVVQHAHKLHDHVKFLKEHKRIQADSPNNLSEKVKAPPSVRKLLDDIAGVRKLEVRVRDEILQDKDARKALLELSIEEGLLDIVTIAEQAITTSEEHQRLLLKHDFGREVIHY